MLILDLWGISFHTVVVFDLVKNFLFKSALGHCGMKGKLKKDTCQTYRFCSHYLIGKNRSYAPHFIMGGHRKSYAFKFSHTYNLDGANKEFQGVRGTFVGISINDVRRFLTPHPT